VAGRATTPRLISFSGYLLHPDVRGEVGCATAPEQALTTGAEEQFAHGRMVWTPNQIIEVLCSDHIWQSFPDTFQG
jgi:hypothetical protein